MCVMRSLRDGRLSLTIHADFRNPSDPKDRSFQPHPHCYPYIELEYPNSGASERYVWATRHQMHLPTVLIGAVAVLLSARTLKTKLPVLRLPMELCPLVNVSKDLIRFSVLTTNFRFILLAPKDKDHYNPILDLEQTLYAIIECTTYHPCHQARSLRISRLSDS